MAHAGWDLGGSPVESRSSSAYAAVGVETTAITTARLYVLTLLLKLCNAEWMKDKMAAQESNDIYSLQTCVTTL